MARVLVVEPDPTLRTMLRDLLAGEGVYAVEAVSAGMDAVRRLAAAPELDVVVLDVRTDGFFSAPRLLALAAEGRLPSRHAYVLLAGDGPLHVPRSLRRRCAVLSDPIVWHPGEAHLLLDVVAAAVEREGTRGLAF